MSRSRPVLTALVSIALAIGFTTFVAAGAQKLTPDEIVKRHTGHAFGEAAPEASRNAGGTCRVSSLMGSGAVDGPFQLTSTAETSRLNLRFGIPTYEGESVAFDGRQVDVAFAQRRTNTRSALGLFLSTYSAIVSDGLLGGVLNRRWPIRNLAARDVKLSSDGVKKLDGRELHRVRYRVNRNQGDLTVHLYFEPETFNHVATVYTATRAQEASALDATAQQADDVFTVSEKFSGFAASPGAAMPRAWVVHYARTGGKTTEWNYECTVQSVQSGS